MKRIPSTLFLFLLFTCAFSQAPDWVWARSAGGTDDDGVYSIATDLSGNIYVAGYFGSDSITFGSTTLLNYASVGYADMFLAKYDAGGNVLWARSAGGNNFDEATSVATDFSGNIYVAGYFSSSSIVFGSTTLANAGSGNPDIFLTKYDPAGNVIWAKSAGGSSNDRPTSVAADVSGSIYVTGYFASPTLSFGATVLTNAGLNNIFLVKYDANGNTSWVKSAGGANVDWPNSVTTDVSGNVYVVGYFSSDSITFGTIVLTNYYSGRNDIFIAKYDSVGNSLWAKCTGGGENDWGNSVALDASGNVYIAGNFTSDSIAFGSTVLTNQSTPYDEMFLAKYDAGGNVLWAKSAGGNGGVFVRCITTDASENVYAIGGFPGDSITLSDTTLANAYPGRDDIFIAKYDPMGNVLWAKRVGGSDYDTPFSVATDDFGSVYIAGRFYSPTLSFGSTSLSDSSSGTTDIFLAKLGNTTTGISETTNPQSEILIYPNPATNQITISVPDDFLSAKAEIIDITGREITAVKLQTTNTKLQTTNFSPGLYFVRISNGEKQAVRKFVVE